MSQPIADIPAAEFVTKQVKLMKEQQLSEEEAFKAVQQDLKAQQEAQGVPEYVEQTETTVAESNTEQESPDEKQRKIASMKEVFNEWVEAEEQFWQAAKEKWHQKK